MGKDTPRIRQPVVRRACFSLAHVPGLVYAGSKPRREIAHEGLDLQQKITAHLRDFSDAVAYPPHQVMIGNLSPETLYTIPRPWHKHPMDNAPDKGPAGCILDAAHLYSWLARGDCANLLRLTNIMPTALQEAFHENSKKATIQKLDEDALQKA